MNRYPVLLIAGLLAISGCTTSKGEDYLNRLERVLQSERPVGSTTTYTYVYPSLRELRLPLPDVRISFAEFLDLSACDISQAVAERNTVLGKHSGSAAVLAYESELLRRLLECENWLDRTRADQSAQFTGPNFLQKISVWTHQKSKNFSAVIWNTPFASKEFQALFSLSRQDSPSDILIHAKYTAEAVDRLADIVQASTSGEIDVLQLMALYKQIERYRVAGSWIRATQNRIDTLVSATLMLETADRATVCRATASAAKATILRNVLNKIYAQRVQPELAQLSSAGSALSNSIQKLLKSVDHPKNFGPVNFYSFMDSYFLGKNNLLIRLNYVSRKHAKAWETLFSDCELPLR